MTIFKRGENLFSFSLKFSDWINLPRANTHLLKHRIKQASNRVIKPVMRMR